MPENSRANLGELIGIAIDRDIITYGCISRESVGLTIGTLDLRLPPEQAYELLHLLLSGAEAAENANTALPRSENPSPPERAGEMDPVDAYQKRELFRAPAPGRDSTSPPVEPSTMSGDGGHYMEEEVSEEYLDSVLSFALTMGIIEGYTKDAGTRTVILRTGATTTGLSYWETLEYLTSSMLYELRPKTQD